MMISTSLIIIIGWNRPYDSALANVMEVFAESTSILCLYCLLLFTDFVQKAVTRYDCGWGFIGAIMLFGAVSIIVIIGVSLRSSRRLMIKTCSLPRQRRIWKRRWNRFLNAW